MDPPEPLPGVLDLIAGDAGHHDRGYPRASSRETGLGGTWTCLLAYILARHLHRADWPRTWSSRGNHPVSAGLDPARDRSPRTCGLTGRPWCWCTSESGVPSWRCPLPRCQPICRAIRLLGAELRSGTDRSAPAAISMMWRTKQIATAIDGLREHADCRARACRGRRRERRRSCVPRRPASRMRRRSHDDERVAQQCPALAKTAGTVGRQQAPAEARPAGAIGAAPPRDRAASTRPAWDRGPALIKQSRTPSRRLRPMKTAAATTGASARRSAKPTIAPPTGRAGDEQKSSACSTAEVMTAPMQAAGRISPHDARRTPRDPRRRRIDAVRAHAPRTSSASRTVVTPASSASPSAPCRRP